MNRVHQSVLVGSTLLGSWLGMQAVHELGHVLGAWLTDGRVSQVVLHPLTISRTDLDHNPAPLVVVWAGPLLGVVAPVLAWGLVGWGLVRGAYVVRFFAGFCLIANGVYIAGGSFDRIGDCGEMLRHGSPIWTLWLFGAVTAPLGLWLWHRQGRHFGLGSSEGEVDVRAAYVTLAVALTLLVLGFIVGGK